MVPCLLSTQWSLSRDGLLVSLPPRLLASPGGSGLGSGRRAGVPATNSNSARRRRAPASLPNARVVLYKGPPGGTLPRENGSQDNLCAIFGRLAPRAWSYAGWHLEHWEANMTRTDVRKLSS